MKHNIIRQLEITKRNLKRHKQRIEKEIKTIETQIPKIKKFIHEI